MLKHNKGITLTALVITIIILGMIVAITISASSPLIDEAKLQEEKTTLLLIQAKWKVEIEKVTFDGTSMFADMGTVITEGENKGYLNDEYKVQVDSKWGVEEGIYYKLSQECLNDMGLSDVNTGKGYIVNYSNNDIILESGFEYDGTTYYKLSDIEKL